ncbi:MAG: transketolase [Anaerolineae bacterium]|nr:transketolase [Anaerolineae bacterium]
MNRTPEQLHTLAYRIRQRSLRMVFDAGMGHTGGDFSAADIYTVLYFGNILRIDPSQPRSPDRDRFFLSKGHSCGTLYTTLAFTGFFPESELDTFMKPLSRLNGHPNRNYVPGIEANTGPLGHGMPIACGAALAAKLDGATWRSYVLTGDGELQEGSNWEAAMAAAQFKLDNLILIVDRNKLQQGGKTESTISLEPLVDKWRAFGWSVREVDGHNHAALLDIFSQTPFEVDKPSCIIAHTHKGQGLKAIKDQAAGHHYVPDNAEDLTAGLAELEGVIE